MLTIAKGASNTLYVTATEKVTISSPYFLFVFTHVASNEQKAFILSNTSTHTERYDEFTFTEGSSTAQTLQNGRHKYQIYAQSSAVNTDPDNANEEVESGVAEVTQSVDSPATNTISQTIKVNVIS